MQYKVTKIDKEYDCGDIDITADMWYGLLKEPKAAQYMDALVSFLREPDHKSSCYLVGKKYDKDSQHFNAKITNFGKWVNSQLDDFTMIGADGERIYWAIPMRNGCETKDGFVWQLRDELVEALQRLLLEQLIEKYKEQYREEHSAVQDELYKWKLLQDCDNKTNLEIVQSLIGKNVIDNAHVDSVLKFLSKDRPSEFSSCISGLFAESINLDERLSIFKSTMRNLCPANWKNSANDERTASALLTCKYPQKYTFYMYKVYNSICQYFGIEQVKAGMIYSHFMRIIKAITARYGDILQNTIKDDVVSYEIAPKLLAVQTMLWVMLGDMNKDIETNQEVSQEENVIMDKSYLQEYIDLLVANYNIILNGAPGTGKTYLAKEIADEIRAKVTEVSAITYDKPKQISDTEIKQHLYPGLLVKSSSGKKKYEIVNVEDCKVHLIGKSITGNGYKIPFENIEKAYVRQLWNGGQYNGDDPYSAALAKYIYEHITNIIKSTGPNVYCCNYKMVQFHPSYDYTDFVEGLRPVKDDRGTIGFERKDGVFKEFCKEALFASSQKYVFIIDEINRGEISKIFGELFFSIDPGYRGEKGKVQTQYQNLVEDGDVFKDGFFVPENVYIIGTMNDIDRSVESMDFAMRRRFAWHEVTAEESAKNMKLNEELTKRMNRLNEVISNTEGLGCAYHVGGSFFLKVQNGEMTVEALWNLNLKSLMKEYLRGLPDADETLERMENAYFLKDNHDAEASLVDE